MVTALDIYQAKAHVENLETDYLRQWGWSQHCDHPGSYWLWTRDFDDYNRRFDAWHEANPDRPRKLYGSYTVPKDLALRMTYNCLDIDDDDD